DSDSGIVEFSLCNAKGRFKEFRLFAGAGAVRHGSPMAVNRATVGVGLGLDLMVGDGRRGVIGRPWHNINRRRRRQVRPVEHWEEWPVEGIEAEAHKDARLCR